MKYLYIFLYLFSIILFVTSKIYDNTYLFSLSIGIPFVTTGLVIANYFRNKGEIESRKKIY